MDHKVKKEKELRFYNEIKLKLNAGSTNGIITTLKELHKSGNPSILPLVLNLLETNTNENIINEVYILLGELKDNKAVPAIVNFISEHPSNKHLAKVISCCWLSGLNFSADLPIFIKSFIEGSYEVALESFTVIEEMIWQTSIDKVKACRISLDNMMEEISDEKKPLFNELLKALDEGISADRD